MTDVSCRTSFKTHAVQDQTYGSAKVAESLQDYYSTKNDSLRLEKRSKEEIVQKAF